MKKLRASCLDASKKFENAFVGNALKLWKLGNCGTCIVGIVGNVGNVGSDGVGIFGNCGLGKLLNIFEKLGIEGTIEGNLGRVGRVGKLGSPGIWKSNPLKALAPIVFTDIESISTPGFGFNAIVELSLNAAVSINKNNKREITYLFIECSLFCSNRFYITIFCICTDKS